MNRKLLTREELRQIARDKAHKSSEAHLHGCQLCGELYFGEGLTWCPYCEGGQLISIGRLVIQEEEGSESTGGIDSRLVAFLKRRGWWPLVAGFGPKEWSMISIGPHGDSIRMLRGVYDMFIFSPKDDLFLIKLEGGRLAFAVIKSDPEEAWVALLAQVRAWMEREPGHELPFPEPME